jgi:hypothetical protein
MGGGADLPPAVGLFAVVAVWHTIHSATQKFDQNPAAEAVRGPIEAYFAARAQAAPQR